MPSDSFWAAIPAAEKQAGNTGNNALGEAGLPIFQMEFILSALQDMQLIRFSLADNFIRPTIYGQNGRKGVC
jgi:hypothetical protein